MSTSIIIALYSKEDSELILLEKTHNGFENIVANLINTALTNCYNDIEYISNYLIKYTDVELSIYSHKYPSEIFLYCVDLNSYCIIEIPKEINKIKECIEIISAHLIKNGLKIFIKPIKENKDESC